LNACVRETKLIAYFLDPLLIGEKDPWQLLSACEESCVLETLRHNKVGMRFRKKLELDSMLEVKVFHAFPRVQVFCDDIELKSKKDSIAFREIKRDFSENNIEFMLIKSDGSFPYESDNLDILIKPSMLRKVITLLKKAGYSELPIARERNKYLFRNTRTPEVLPLHIHTEVEWEERFLDSACLWNRSEGACNNGGFFVPSPEDCILITSAHLFFENHEVKIADLLKIASKFRNYSLDWDYMLGHAKRLHWNDAFCLAMLLVNLVHRDLCGKDMLQQNVLAKIEDTKPIHLAFFQGILRSFSSGCTPINIPYSVSVLFFLLRVLRESDLSLVQRFKHIGRVVSNVLRERIIRSEKLDSFEPLR